MTEGSSRRSTLLEGFVEIILNSERDRRTLDWLISQVGIIAVENACKQLAGKRKPYVSNIAKILRLKPPESVLLTPKEDATKRLRDIKKLLSK